MVCVQSKFGPDLREITLSLEMLIPGFVLCMCYTLGSKMDIRYHNGTPDGIFMGTSPLHASTVGLIRNPRTNRLSPQFHCVYDDNFETVHSNDPNTPLP